MMRGCVVVLFVILALFDTLDAAGCHGAATYGTPNSYPVLDGHSVAKLVSTVPNGKLYKVTVPNDGGNTTSTYNVVHLWGTPYEMGFAQGSLLKTEAQNLISSVWTYMESQVINALPSYFPTWFSDLIAEMGLDAALDFTEWASGSYTGQYFFDEIKGLCDAANLDYTTVYRIHMIAGLTQGDCSMFGAWGKALDPTSTTKVLQLRALDWDMDGPFRDYSQITVYHPNSDNGHAFANVGFTGFIGGLTGISSTKLGISEIGVAFPDATFGSESRLGVPFIFLLRDILQFDETVDSAISRMATAHRTCDLILGVGDGKLGEFRGFEYSYSTLNVFDDMNMMPYNSTWHPRVTNAVYWGMDWDCPSYNTVLSKLILQYHGKITPEVAIRYISAVEKSGDNHIAFYDLTNLELYVSFASARSVGGPPAAYNRQYSKWNATLLFNEATPY